MCVLYSSPVPNPPSQCLTNHIFMSQRLLAFCLPRFPSSLSASFYLESMLLGLKTFYYLVFLHACTVAN